MIDWNAPRMQMVRTRSGIGPALVPERKITAREKLGVRYYAPKPAWMDYIPGPSLRFAHRIDFDRFMAQR